ncbi:serine/threonine protein kinase [Sorangium cellulosum]|uniref:Serine/threonine protein kinase n=1 Tax=Sorangium cellulosum TaxID=56 RepID=A0A4P2Q337_SORCE|nr:protein kinase [Sorangium cellulosum]AUX23398.1 serine/threonine protein kinase [Sorangium cellulosum]
MRCSVCHRRIGAIAGCPLHRGVAAEAPAAEVVAAEAAPRVAGFEALRLLGEGGFARVFAAVRRADGLAVALKIARHRGEPRFSREAAALRRLGPPTVPRLLGAGALDGGVPYLVLELIDGETLSRWMAALPGTGAAAPAEAARLVGALGAAVDRAHAAGVVHRDLKPENVMLRRKAGPMPEVALLDLGLARLEEGRRARGEGPPPTHTGLRLGSVTYMAPEQCLDARDVDARADLYALGILAFELLTGRPPFVGEAASVVHAHVAQRPPRPSEIAPVPRGVDEVLLRALAKSREERFGSAHALSEALRAALTGAIAAPALPDIERPLPDIEAPRRDIEKSISDIGRPLPDIEAPRRDIGKSISDIEKPIPGDKNPLQAVDEPSRRPGEPPHDAAARPAAPPRRSPVALVAVRGGAPMDQVVSIASSFGGRLARVHDGLYVVAFPGPPRPRARAALQAARRLVAALADGTSAAVHVADLRVREGASGMVFAGPALARAAAFWPPGAADPVAITPEAAALLGDGAEDDPSAPSASPAAPDLQATATPLRGRDELVAEVVAHARAAFRDGAPLLCTLLGEIGHGKTRLSGALAEALSAEPGARVIAVAARPPDLAEPAGLARALLRACLAVEPGAGADALRAACVARLGPELGLASWPAVAFTLDALSGKEPAVAAVLAAPGALRQTLARAVGEALRRLAEERPLALLVDDAQWGDQGGLDALEIATLPGARAPLAVVVAASPALPAMRPLHGERAARSLQRALAPLDAGAARALLLDRLHPVEFVPEPVVAGLLASAQGVPLFLVELAAALRHAGAIRKVRGGPGWYLAGDEIARGEAAPVMTRLARRALAGLPPPLAELATVCAVAGDASSLAEIGRLLDDAARARAVSACGDLDPGVGASRLVRRGLLRVVGAERLAFAHPLLREAIEAEVPAGARRRLHGVALRGLLAAPGEGGARLARIARHAAAAGAHAEAAAACFELAEDARRRHLYVDAERHYTAALAALAEAAEEPEVPEAAEEQAAEEPEAAAAAGTRPARAALGRTSERPVRQAAVLAGRGKVRHRIQRFDDAASDLRAARALAEAEEDAALIADLLLEEATVLDWCGDYAGSQALVDLAAPLAARLGDAGLGVRCDVAAGRGHFRRQEIEAAIARLAPAARRAAALGDHESHVIALLLLAPALVYARRVDEAEARLEEVMARCASAGDRLHLGVAYMNRLFVRLMREDPEGAVGDLRIAVALARELGSAFLERGPTHNLAELLYWSGELSEALPLAVRAWELQQRFFEASLVPDYALLVARIHCARGELDDARRHLDWVLGHADLDALPPVTRALVRLCAQVVQGGEAPDALWDALVAEVRGAALLSEHIEVLCFAAEAALRGGRLAAARRWLGEAAAETSGSRFWRGRLARLAAAIERRSPP